MNAPITFEQLPSYVLSLNTKIDQLLELLQQQPSVSSAPVDEVLTIEQAAALLNVKKATLYQMVHARKIPFSKPNGRKLYFSRTELVAWIQAGRKRTNTELEADARAYTSRGKRKA